MKAKGLMAFRTQDRKNSDADNCDTSLEQLDSSVEMRSPPSPSEFTIQPRKLRFADDDLDKDGNSPLPQMKKSTDLTLSPPYRKVRALRLFDTPATPKTILQKSTNHLSAATPLLNSCKRNEVFKIERPRSIPLHTRPQSDVNVNVNPFTPDSLLAQKKKRCRTQFGRDNLNNVSLQQYLLTDKNEEVSENADSDDPDRVIEMHQAPKRLALQDTSISRFEREFKQMTIIGVGEFGVVFQCVNRLDGCIYAIKRTKKPVAGSSFEKRALNEVWAHAVLGKHDNVVRYYSAWAEDDHMLIQNEFCNGGSLQSLIQKHFLNECELKTLLLHVAEGLRYIHSNGLVHMDLKPGNIFLTMDTTGYGITLTDEDQYKGSKDSEDDEDVMSDIYEELRNSENIVTYKIGDLGHVTSVKEPHVEEGDCRYLPKEILHEDYKNLAKADIFSLGITLYEVAGGGELKKNGPEWHKLRDGDIPAISTLSAEFNDLIKKMTHPDPNKRPSSTTIFDHPVLCTMGSKTKLQLTQELAVAKSQNDILLNRLREAKKKLQIFEKRAKHTTQLYDDQRCLRSCIRRLRTPLKISDRFNGLRDRNKNLIKNIK